MKIRPKVRYTYWLNKACDPPLAVIIEAKEDGRTICQSESIFTARRICRALNHHEAVRRGEIRVSK